MKVQASRALVRALADGVDIRGLDEAGLAALQFPPRDYLYTLARQWRSGSRKRFEDAGEAKPIIPTQMEVLLKLRTIPQPFHCMYCGRKIGQSKKTKLNMDHKIPVSRGGTAHPDNLGISCQQCNSAKGPLNSVEFQQLLKLLGSWDPGASAALLTRLRGGFWCYRPAAEAVRALRSEVSDFAFAADLSDVRPLEVPEAQPPVLDVPWPL